MEFRFTARIAAALVASLFLGACSGPSTSLRIGGKTVPVGVTFDSALDEPAPPPADGVPLPLLPVSRPVPPRAANQGRPVLAPPPGPREEDCPSARGFPKKAATNLVDGPPAEAAYPFRARIRQRVGAQEITYEGPVTRTVRNVRRQDGTITYEVVQDIAGQAFLTTGYLADSNRLALRFTEARSPDGTFRFRPLTPVTILPLPPVTTEPTTAQRIDTWRSVGVDPQSGLVMTVEGKVDAPRRINACGEPVDAWAAESTTELTGRNLRWTTAGKTNVATQYGGLIVHEDTTTDGTLDNRPYALDFAATISRPPED